MKIKKGKILEVKNLNVKYGFNQRAIIKNFKIEIFKGGSHRI